MHVRSACGLAEGIHDFFSSEPDPAAVVSVLPIVNRTPADLRGLQALAGLDDALGDFRHEKPRILLVLAGAEAAHRRGSGVSVRGRDHHAVHGNAALLRGERFGLVNKPLIHHAGVHDSEGDLHLPIVEHNGSRIELAGQALAAALQKAARDDARESLWRDVGGDRTGAEDGLSRGGKRDAGERKQEERFHRGEDKPTLATRGSCRGWRKRPRREPRL